MLKRLARYLKGAPRLILSFAWQEATNELVVCADSDWAGCPRSRKSTSGGVVFRGRHVLKHWSTTQSTVALSSGEAELISLVKGTSEGLGLQSMLEDAGVDTWLHVRTDAAAALGMAQRTGVGKVRHLDTRLLWIQDYVRAGRVHLSKIDGLLNSADALTKYLSSSIMSNHLLRMGWRLQEGRAESAPVLEE